MKKLYELMNFDMDTCEGRLQHVSSYQKYYNDGEKKYVYYHEDYDGCIETALVTTSEYWTKLKANPLMLKNQRLFTLLELKEVIGENSDLVYLNTDYYLSQGNICYYLLYNFKYIKATLHIETLTVTVHKKNGFGKMVNCEIPKMDYLALVALVMEEFKEEPFEEYTKLHCTRCNHTYYALGPLDREDDSCVLCNKCENVVIVKNQKISSNVS